MKPELKTGIFAFIIHQQMLYSIVLVLKSKQLTSLGNSNDHRQFIEHDTVDGDIGYHTSGGSAKVIQRIQEFCEK